MMILCIIIYFVNNALIILNVFKVASTSGPFFEKIMKRYPIFSLQINYYQIIKRHE